MSTTTEGGNNKRRSIRWKPIIQIAIFILILLVVLIISTIVVTYYSLQSLSGRFTLWQSLGSPPERALRIVGLCFDSVCVETENNSKYFHCASNDNCWTKTNLLDEDVIPFSAQLANPCMFEFEIPSPPPDTIQIAGAKTCSSGGDGQTYYALQEDGTVWVWSHNIPDLASIAALGALWLGLQIGLAIDIVVVIVVLFVRQVVPRQQELQSRH
jgi:hypothetical protein